MGKGKKMQQEYNICPNKLPHTIYLKIQFNVSYGRLCDLDNPREKWLNFANNGYPDQMPHFAVSGLDLHCFPITCLGSPN